MTIDQYNDLIEGTEVILDDDFSNSSIVTLISKDGLYSTVYSDGSTWQVMTYRLTPKTEV